jgi:hypothetical protein
MPDDEKITAETCGGTEYNKYIKKICIKTDRKSIDMGVLVQRKIPNSSDKKSAQNMMSIINKFTRHVPVSLSYPVCL